MSNWLRVRNFIVILMVDVVCVLVIHEKLTMLISVEGVMMVDILLLAVAN